MSVHGSAVALASRRPAEVAAARSRAFSRASTAVSVPSVVAVTRLSTARAVFAGQTDTAARGAYEANETGPCCLIIVVTGVILSQYTRSMRQLCDASRAFKCAA